MKIKNAIVTAAGLLGMGNSSVSADLVQSLSNVVADGTIVIGGGGAGWAGLTPFQADPNEGSTQDWHRVTIANDTSYFYFRYEMNAGAVYPAWQYALYLDTDLSRSTGFIGGSGQLSIGADVIIEGAGAYSFSPSAGTSWSIESYLGEATYSFNGDYTVIEFSVPISVLGTDTFNFLLVGSGEVAGNHYDDYYLDSSNQGETGGYLQYTAVPEPGALLLTTAGLGWVVLRRRHRRA
jgi:hypothetical protein